MRRFVFKLIGTVLPVLAVVLGINISRDTGMQFDRYKKSDEIAGLLVSGKNVAVKQLPTEWGSLQIRVFSQMQQHKTEGKDILVFGTSRASEISSGLFPGKTLFNCAVPGGNFLDYMALYGLYERRHAMPKYLIISLDPWSFHARTEVNINGNYQQVSDLSKPLLVNRDLFQDYKTGIRDLHFKYDDAQSQAGRDLLQVGKELLNPSYLRLNLMSLGGKLIFGTDADSINGYFVIRKDGGYSLLSPSKIDSNAVQNRVLNMVDNSKTYSKDGKPDLFVAADTASRYYGYFKTFLIDLKNSGTIPIVYISPLNPVLYDGLKPADGVRLEDNIRSFCKANDIEMVGSFNPHPYGYHTGGKHFIDGYHPVRSVVEHVFSQHRQDLEKIGLSVK